MNKLERLDRSIRSHEPLTLNPLVREVFRGFKFISEHPKPFGYTAAAVLFTITMSLAAKVGIDYVINEADAEFTVAWDPKFADPGKYLGTGDKYYPVMRVAAYGRDLATQLQIAKEGDPYNIRDAGFASRVLGKVPQGTVITRVIVPGKGPYGIFECAQVSDLIRTSGQLPKYCGVTADALAVVEPSQSPAVNLQQVK